MSGYPQMALHVIIMSHVLSIIYNTETQGFIHAQSGYIR